MSVERTVVRACDVCGWETSHDKLKLYGDKGWLCEVCAAIRPSFLAALAWVANAILAEVRKLKRKGVVHVEDSSA